MPATGNRQQREERDNRHELSVTELHAREKRSHIPSGWQVNILHSYTIIIITQEGNGELLGRGTKFVRQRWVRLARVRGMEIYLFRAAAWGRSGENTSELVVARDIMATLTISAMIYIVAMVLKCRYPVRVVRGRKKTNCTRF